MNEPHDDAPLDPLERELSERLLRGDDAASSGDDSPLLRRAAAWLSRLDELTVEVEQARTPERGPDPDPLAIRDAVLARIGGESVRRAEPSAGRRARQGAGSRSGPGLPWWRTAAPLALAAGLAGLFLWQELGGNDPIPPAPSALEAPETDAPRPEGSAVGRTDALLDEARPKAEVQAFGEPGGADRDEPSKEGAERSEVPPVAQESAASLREDQAPAPLARRMASLTRTPAEVDSMIFLLERPGIDISTFLRLRSELFAVQAATADTTLAARIGRALAEAGTEPR